MRYDEMGGKLVKKALWSLVHAQTLWLTSQRSFPTIWVACGNGIRILTCSQGRSRIRSPCTTATVLHRDKHWPETLCVAHTMCCCHKLVNPVRLYGTPVAMRWQWPSASYTSHLRHVVWRYTALFMLGSGYSIINKRNKKTTFRHNHSDHSTFE